ncbi:MAG TPA: methionine--tRNA ligase [Candidatus Nitrosocosmicus sp.]|nr:methionine--tRNA ligase [Candidatus Nitrosocosmicus sp.]
MKKIYITTAIDYTNDVIHLGHAYQKIVADALARYYRITYGKENVYFVTGTDEYGSTSEKAAKKAGKASQEYVDEISIKDKEQYDLLNISYDRFIRTTDADHKDTVYDFYNKVLDNDDIYKGTYQGLYCEGCEAYKTITELQDGKCPLHLTREIQKVEEENYFFKWSKYRDFLKDHITNSPEFILPANRRNEMLAFLEEGLEDIPISRPNYKVPWGIPLPNDKSQTIYVWFDALINYYTGSIKHDMWDADTTIIHVLGKDNLRWHTLLWPAMLKSANLRLPDSILTHGFINLNGQKISKSLGNVIRPSELVEQFGADAVRYYLLKYGPATEDVDISIDKLKNAYNSELANDWGNLVSRIAKLCEKNNFINSFASDSALSFTPQIAKDIEAFNIYDALMHINHHITDVNQYINREEPWTLTSPEATEGQAKKLSEILFLAVKNIRQIAFDLLPFIPESSEQILQQFLQERIVANKPYFERKK